MKKRSIKPWISNILFIALGILISSSCETLGDLSNLVLDATFYERLAERWAPVHYQDVDPTGGDGLNGRADYITAINFDGDWDAQNNWENLEDPIHSVDAYGYYSVVQTSTHWFILYAYYHPRDWVDLEDFNLDTHENDMEGLLTIVRRPAQEGPNEFGELQGMITVYHLDFFSYITPGSPLTEGQEDIDGTLEMENVPDQLNAGMLHPVTAQQSKGHGIKAHPQVQIEGGDGIKYFPSVDVAQSPSGPNDRAVKYKLINIFEPGGLWDHRDDPLTFASPGVFRGDDGGDNKANAPWNWDDNDDGSNLRGGELATNPAKLVNIYFDDLGDFSTTYEFNLYQGIQPSSAE